MKKYLLVESDKEEDNMSDVMNTTSELQSADRIPRGIEVEENRIFFYTGVGQNESLELNRLLRRLDIEMQYLSNRLHCKAIPIHLHIQSPGGSIFAGLSIVDTIKRCKTDVYTYIEGSAASAATLISICGKKRFISKNSFMLVHQPQLEWAGKYDEFLDEIKNQESVMKAVKDVYLDNTKLKVKDLEELLKHELWLNADTCIELGLVDSVL